MDYSYVDNYLIVHAVELAIVDTFGLAPVVAVAGIFASAIDAVDIFAFAIYMLPMMPWNLIFSCEPSIEHFCLASSIYCYTAANFLSLIWHNTALV